MSLSEKEKRPLHVTADIAALLRDLVHERTGIFFEDERCQTLLEKIQPLAEERGCHSYFDLFHLLKYEDQAPQNWDSVVDMLSVPETYFWREMAQIDVLVKRLVPQWFARSSHPMRIWCAACATGEEPFSIRMALEEAGFGSHPIEITASDVSPACLQKACAGIYREKSFRSLPPALREKYFVPAPGGSLLRAEISSRVTFHRANLMSPKEIVPLARVQVVFCRNVFLYFSSHAIRQILATLATRMPERSYLFVGAAESLLKLSADFELQELGEAFGYVRI